MRRDIRELPSTNFDDRKYFECLDETMIISSGRICDGRFDCPDLSDECLCVGRSVPDLCNDMRMTLISEYTPHLK